MAYKPEKFISTFIHDQQNSLKQLINKVQQLDALANQVNKLLPEEFINKVTVANFRQGCLVLQVDNGAWATKLRFQTPMLLSGLRNDGIPELVSINIIVRP